MKTLLIGINSKYIHPNVAIRLLKANCNYDVDIKEFNIKDSVNTIYDYIISNDYKIVGISCYIWNIGMVEQVAGWLSKVAPKTRIWFGGPEVSFDVEDRLNRLPYLEGVMCGEGEATFRDMMAVWNGDMDLEAVRGIGHRAEQSLHMHESRDFVDMSDLNFVYTKPEEFKHKIIYYETSRGCPFQCSYCLSSVEKKVRFRDLNLVKSELLQFIEWEVPQVKFVDRTFNCKREHSMEILKFIKEHDRGKTNFHFEVTADLLTEEELDFMATLRPGLIQLEIGVQSTCPETLKFVVMCLLKNYLRL